MDETMVNRRSFVKGLGLMGGVAAMGMIAGCSSEPAAANDADPKEQPQDVYKRQVPRVPVH